MYNRGFKSTNYSNPNLIHAGKGLSPSILRFGGSRADNLVYGLNPGSPECGTIPDDQDCGYFTIKCLNSTHWDSLYNLAVQSDSKLLFGISFDLEGACGPGAAGADHVWNSSNTRVLLNYINQGKLSYHW